jgi:hypothetical protein
MSQRVHSIENTIATNILIGFILRCNVRRMKVKYRRSVKFYEIFVGHMQLVPQYFLFFLDHLRANFITYIKRKFTHVLYRICKSFFFQNQIILVLK